MTAYRYPQVSLIQLSRPGKNPAYRAWVRKQPCLITGRTWQIDFCHTGHRGLGQKGDDLDGIPLFWKLHRAGFENSYHALGRVRFEEYWGINIQNEILRLQERAVACGISLEPTIKRKGLGRAGMRKTVNREGAA